MKKLIALILAGVLFLLPGCAGIEKGTEEESIDMEAVKEKLISNTEYVKQNIIGTWSTSDGTIMEFYSNGMTVNYKPMSMDVWVGEYVVKSELNSIGYSGYEIVDPESYTDVDLQSYAMYLQQSDKIGISIKFQFFGVMNDKFVLHEFQDDNVLKMGDITLERIKSGEPSVTDSMSGVYVNEADKTIGLCIIQESGKESGYFTWDSNKYELYGNCEFTADEVFVNISDTSGSVFKKEGNDLIEIGTGETSGSKVIYKKISDLT